MNAQTTLSNRENWLIENMFLVIAQQTYYKKTEKRWVFTKYHYGDHDDIIISDKPDYNWTDNGDKMVYLFKEHIDYGVKNWETLQELIDEFKLELKSDPYNHFYGVSSFDIIMGEDYSGGKTLYRRILFGVKEEKEKEEEEEKVHTVKKIEIEGVNYILIEETEEEGTMVSRIEIEGIKYNRTEDNIIFDLDEEIIGLYNPETKTIDRNIQFIIDNIVCDLDDEPVGLYNPETKTIDRDVKFVEEE